MVTLRYIQNKFKLDEHENAKAQPIYVNINGRLELVSDVNFENGKWIFDIQ